MKWLTLEEIKRRVRIDYSDTLEDEDLIEMGMDAEEMVLNDIGRTVEELVEEYGQVPRPLHTAALLLVAASYQHREPVSQYNMSIVPYGYDKRVKPYMRLADE